MVVVVVHGLMAPALVLGHMNRHVHLLDDRHMDLLVDGNVLDHRHVLDDVNGDLDLLGVMVVDGVHFVRHVDDDVLAVERVNRNINVNPYKFELVIILK